MSYMSWSVSQVIKRLDELDLGQYSSQFEKNDISGPVLPLLTDAHLKELGMKIIGHRLKFLKYVQSLMKGGSNRSSSSSSRNNNSRPQQQPPRQKPQSPPQEQDNSSEDDNSTPGTGGTSNGGGAASSWEQKRRQMMLKKMQANKQVSPTPSNGRLLSPEIIEEVPKNNKPQPEPTRPKPKSRPPPPPSNDDEDESDDDAYTPPPPPKRPARKVNPSPPPPDDDDGGDDDRVECAYCHRKFATDRIEKHEQICSRMSSKKKRVFDASKQRLQGTEAAQFVSKTKNKDEPKPKPSKFKQEHEKLVEALRAARKIQAYEKAKEEGKAVGPPPELPKYEIADDDRVPCPYCGRKFGAEAAQKHIAVCERMNGGRMRGGAANKRNGKR